MSCTAANIDAAPAGIAASFSTARKKLCVALIVLLAFSLGCTEFAPIGIEPELADAFGVSLAQIGQLISVFALTYAVATPTLALATGRFRRFTMLVIYAGVFILGNVVAATATGMPALYVSRVICGLVSGAFLAVGVTFLPELVDPRKTSFAVAVVYAAFSVAMVLATSAGKMLADALDWRAMMVACLILAVVTCALLIALLSREGATDEPARVRDQFPLLCEPSVLACVAIFVFGVGSTYVFYGYVTPYLEEYLGLTAAQTSLVLLVFGVILFFSNMLSGVLDEKFGLKSDVGLFLTQAAVLAALWAVGTAMPAALIVIFTFGLLMYAVSVPCITLFMRMANERHPKALTLASSLEPTAFNIGIAFGTAVGGAAVTGLGLGSLGLVGAALALVACGCAVAAVRLEP